MFAASTAPAAHADDIIFKIAGRWAHKLSEPPSEQRLTPDALVAIIRRANATICKRQHGQREYLSYSLPGQTPYEDTRHSGFAALSFFEDGLKLRVDEAARALISTPLANGKRQVRVDDNARAGKMPKNGGASSSCPATSPPPLRLDFDFGWGDFGDGDSLLVPGAAVEEFFVEAGSRLAATVLSPPTDGKVMVQFKLLYQQGHTNKLLESLVDVSRLRLVPSISAGKDLLTLRDEGVALQPLGSDEYCAAIAFPSPRAGDLLEMFWEGEEEGEEDSGGEAAGYWPVTVVEAKANGRYKVVWRNEHGDEKPHDDVELRFLRPNWLWSSVLRKHVCQLGGGGLLHAVKPPAPAIMADPEPAPSGPVLVAEPVGALPVAPTLQGSEQHLMTVCAKIHQQLTTVELPDKKAREAKAKQTETQAKQEAQDKERAVESADRRAKQSAEELAIAEHAEAAAKRAASEALATFRASSDEEAMLFGPIGQAFERSKAELEKTRSNVERLKADVQASDAAKREAALNLPMIKVVSAKASEVALAAAKEVQEKEAQIHALSNAVVDVKRAWRQLTTVITKIANDTTGNDTTGNAATLPPPTVPAQAATACASPAAAAAAAPAPLSSTPPTPTPAPAAVGAAQLPLPVASLIEALRSDPKLLEQLDDSAWQRFNTTYAKYETGEIDRKTLLGSLFEIVGKKKVKEMIKEASKQAATAAAASADADTSSVIEI